MGVEQIIKISLLYYSFEKKKSVKTDSLTKVIWNERKKKKL
jgi:hypothetical protein